MDVKKMYQRLKQLYNYGECKFYDSLSYLELHSLLERKQSRCIITNNWINYGQSFQSEQDHLLSLFCFQDDYQKYLVEVALLTALKMSEVKDQEGIKEFVSHLPKFSAYAVSVLTEIKTDSGFSIVQLEECLKKKEDQYQSLDRLIFDGSPYYHRIMFYLKHVQAYQQEEVMENIELGRKIDEKWQKRRKICADLSLAPLKERPLHTLIPFVPESKMIDHPQFQHIFTFPWKLFVFLCCIVRENFEAQGVQAIRFQEVGNAVDVLLTSSNYRQFRYGSIDEFTIDFCKANQYQLFPYEVSNLQTVFQNLVARKLLTIVDDEYRLPTTIEDFIYHTRLYIPLIAESKQLRRQMEQWIDELREK